MRDLAWSENLSVAVDEIDDDHRRLVDKFNIKRDTVLNHLYNYLEEGNQIIESDEWLSLSTVSPEQKEYILDRFEALGTERLRPVLDALGGEVDYEELKILRLHYISRKGIAENVPISAPVHEPLIKNIICLANSRKFSGRCIAGKEVIGNRIGEWIRPVSPHETGELSFKEIQYKDGNTPGLLDVIGMPLTRHDPHSYQTENYLVEEGPWVREGQFPFKDLPGLCDPVDSLWLNGYHSRNGLNDRMPEEIVREKIRASLLFIRPDKAGCDLRGRVKT